ncbi:hypothetical protein OSB04_009530 [Centaurea solstitialis]|uniref:Legume lectin domain-containing protein n=1 Tax=Centaurea solstitialis TaxID=347529 RepID=A0AA38WNG2_9ASTR|nr:hypothetical protein OSB04_009530 [Centaurea solstitialis]
MAFVITPNHEAIGGAGGRLGIPNDAVAVEFNTAKDAEFDGNHVALDVGSVDSYRVANLHAVKINLRSGKEVKCWIDYSGPNQQLNISISYNNTKPEFPLISAPLNLGRHVKEVMYVGFSGSTQGSTERHSLVHWSFTKNRKRREVEKKNREKVGVVFGLGEPMPPTRWTDAAVFIKEPVGLDAARRPTRYHSGWPKANKDGQKFNTLCGLNNHHPFLFQ